MRAIFCLGNPGREYADTRHNVGFLVADALAARHGIDMRRNRLRAQFGRGIIADEDALLVKPQTFMNDSGDAVHRIAHFFKLRQPDVLVVYDDHALDLGQIRARPGGSDAGHRGMRSVAARMGTHDIARLRLGIGPLPPGRESRDFVLGNFRPAERETVEDMVSRAAEAVEYWARDGIEATMNRFNG